MSDIRKLEQFIINTDDVISLMELYATRIKSYPDDRTYYHTLEIQCGEFLIAARKLDNELILEVARHLHRFVHLLVEKGATAKPRQMEVFIEEIQDLTNYLKNLFKDRSMSFDYSSNNMSLLKNYIRKLQNQKTALKKSSRAEHLVEDPFDEIEGLGNFVDSFLNDLDSAFDSISSKNTEQKGTSSKPFLTESEQEEVESLFLSISSAYIQPVKDFISELKGGSASKNWINICLSSLKIIENAGTKMNYEIITKVVQRFKKLMMQAQYSPTPTISREIRIQLLKEYANLSRLMPEAFATSEAHASKGSLKDAIIINVILKKTPGIGPISRNKLITAGLNSLDKYYMATSEEIAAVSGIHPYQAEAVKGAFERYRESVKLKTRLNTKEQVSLTRLYGKLRELKQVQKKYKDSIRLSLYSSAYELEKNRFRLKRQQTMWDINMVLAELDEFGLIEELKKMVYERRIERLEEYLESEMPKYFS